MEHRWTPRQTLRTSVVLRRRGHTPSLCRSRDAGPEGMYIEHPAGIDHLHPGIGVELEIELISPPRDGRVQVPAIVVHGNERGVGVMFSRFDPLGLSDQPTGTLG